MSGLPTISDNHSHMVLVNWGPAEPRKSEVPTSEGFCSVPHWPEGQVRSVRPYRVVACVAR